MHHMVLVVMIHFMKSEVMIIQLALFVGQNRRNFEAVLDMMSSAERLILKSLITHRYDIENAVEAY